MMCDRTNPHVPHFWSRAGGRVGALESCPGIDTEPLAPERDRPTWDIPDLTPETLHLTDAAALVVRAFNNGNPTSAYPGMIAVWQELCGLSEPEAITYAFQIAMVVPVVEGVVIPL